MGCEVLQEREGKPVPGVKGLKGEDALALRAVDISDFCIDLDIHWRVCLTFVRGSNSRMQVVASIEVENGGETRRWYIEKLKENLDPKQPREYKPFSHIKGFAEFARKIGLAQTTFARLIIDKVPKMQKN